jgi:DNA-binding XRE family transcriptional regulator
MYKNAYHIGICGLSHLQAVEKYAIIIGINEFNAYYMNIFTVPSAVTERLQRLGARIRTARLRRGWTVFSLAQKAGINRNTLTAIEQGKLVTSIASLAAVLWALGLDEALETVADPDRDLHGKALEASRRPQRMRSAASGDYDF